MAIDLKHNGNIEVGNDIIVAGDVGIGTSSPNAKLHVSADILVNGVTVGRGAGNIDTNTVVGRDALRNNTEGGSNTALGRSALISNTTGAENTAVGQGALRDNTTGGSNIVFGRDAGRRISNGNNQTITNNSIFIGQDTRALANNQTNQIVIGHQAVGVGSNSVVLGNDSITKTILKGDVGIGTTSPNRSLTVNGNLSVSEFKNFKINHPLPQMESSHDLYHSSVEAPQADNIYRGKIDLIDGKAEINLDIVSRMTEGTFVSLNTNIQCFTSNESDWDSVRGKVDGNILKIECQNNKSKATISWLVIGERCDKDIINSNLTDENGKMITEHLKEDIEFDVNK